MIPSDGKEQYVKAYSHAKLAKDWSISLLSLESYAAENGWTQEHQLYWKDQALEVLKKNCEEHNIAAVKELLRAVAGVRPVGRPPKSEVQKNLAIETRILREYEEDAARLEQVSPLSIVK